MASRRMFSLTIVDTDAFLNMPLSAQALYFHLAMRADDDGFVDKPETIRNMTKATIDDLKLLLAKQFLIYFDTGVIVIKHWRIHNYIQNDRKKDTFYQDEFNTLGLKNNVYIPKNQLPKLPANQAETSVYPECIQTVSKMETQDRIGEDRDSLVKDIGDTDPPTQTQKKPANTKKEKPINKQIPPALENVVQYAKTRGYPHEAEKFYDYYTSCGWTVGKKKMVDWQSAFRNWEKNSVKYSATQQKNTSEKPKGKKRYDSIVE